MSPQTFFDDTLDVILKSPQMDHVVKYVANGTNYADAQLLPWDVSMVIVQVGCDASYLQQNDTRRQLLYFMDLFNPFTKLIVIVDYSNFVLMNHIMSQIYKVMYACVIFFDSATKHVVYCNGALCWDFPSALPPVYLFTYGRRWYKGLGITYAFNGNILATLWNYDWVEETARHMNTEAVEYQHNCSKLTGKSFYHCLMECKGNQNPLDIIFLYIYMTNANSRYRRAPVIYTSIPLHMKIAVPRDRPLNVAELLVMPFSWQVWVLLIVIFVLSEIIKHRFPGSFKNDPTLLAVCGFEQHDLNQAGRSEKILFLSLITLMFFITNAFETKIVSMMISKPSVQRIQTLADLAKSNLRFHEDLEASPHFAAHPVMSSMVVHGEAPTFSETVPGVAMLWYSDFAEVRLDVSFDFVRMQPFYVLLDYEFTIGPETYEIWYRDIFAEALRSTHLSLVENGIMKCSKDLWRRLVRLKHLGRRARREIENKVELEFDDMQPGWMVLLVGLLCSVAFFLGERLKYHLDTCA